jgi:hypothetical protein
MPKLFEEPFLYSEDRKHWSKSVSEMGKFIIDNLEHPDFLAFLRGEDIESPRLRRWRERYADLLDKAQTRLGYHLDAEKLMSDAKQAVINQADSGEIMPTKRIEELRECVLSELG